MSSSLCRYIFPVYVLSISLIVPRSAPVESGRGHNGQHSEKKNIWNEGRGTYE